MKQICIEHFDKLLSLAALLVSVSILFGVIAFKATDFYKLAEITVGGAFSSFTTLLTAKAVNNWLNSKPGETKTND